MIRPFRYNPNTGRGEIVSIVLMRGIASLMVCFLHLSFGNRAYLPDSSIIKRAGEWGYAGIYIFFIVSGFIIPYSMFLKGYTIKDFKVFFIKRLIRIEPPYIVSIIIMLVFGYISSLMPFYRGAPFDINWGNVAGHLAYLNAFTGAKWLQDVYWTLAIEFQFYLVAAICYPLLISKNFYLRFLFFVSFISAYALYPHHSNSFIFSFSPYFMMGLLLFQFYCQVINKSEFFILQLITISSAIYYDGLPLAIICITAMAMISFIRRVHPIFLFLGSISYSLYLIHIPVGGRFVSIISRFLKDSVLLKEILVFLATGFSIFMAWGFYILVEKRFKIISSRINYKKRVLP